MAAAKQKSIAKLCIALGLFILAGFFRQLDRVTAPLPSAACFLLTNLIYIGLAMAWGFSISRRILHRNDRRWLLLGCAMAVLWLFLRAVKYRFFSDDTITRYLWYLYYVPQVLAPLFSLFAALQMGRREDEAFSGWWHLMYLPAALLIGGSFSWIASSDPDGLEWSIEKTTGQAELETVPDGLHRKAAAIQEKTAVIPDYNTTFAGIIGSGAILLAVFGVSYLFRTGQKQG